MKKMKLLTTAALLSVVLLGSNTMTAAAAPADAGRQCGTYNHFVYYYILKNLGQRPCPPVQLPDTNLPDTDLPDNNLPGDNTPDSTPGTEALSYTEQVVKLVNAERAKEGLSPLTVDVNVQAAAQVRAVEIQTSFSHTRPNGSSFSTALKEQNVSYRSASENIAWGQRSPQEVVTAWMNSAGHRANIMNANFTKIGVGYHQNANDTKYWSQLFIQ